MRLCANGFGYDARSVESPKIDGNSQIPLFKRTGHTDRKVNWFLDI